MRHLTYSNFGVQVYLLVGILLTTVKATGQDDTPFPQPKSKKGLQVQMAGDALELGVKHAALNVNLAQLVNVSGKEITFVDSYVEHLDGQIKRLSARGVVVSLILLYYRSGNDGRDGLMLHPKYDPAAPNNLSAFNTTNPESAAAFTRCIEFLAERYSRKDEAHGRVWNYIMGNEVNSHWFWCNMGRVSMAEFADDYLGTMRLCHQAVRRHSARARVYLSLEHHWNMRYPGGDERQAFAGKAFVDYFAKRARETGDFDWHIAFHPYPENLFDCRTWNDKTAVDSPDTPRITFKNLEVLTAYLRRDELLHKGKPRRVILSEQGFHSPQTGDGETLQAAAYCYAYYKTAHLDGIDSFILHRHVDHGHEGGLNLGLWTRNKGSAHPAEPLAKKKIYEVFKSADQPNWEEVFAFALPIIDVPAWSALLRGSD